MTRWTRIRSLLLGLVAAGLTASGCSTFGTAANETGEAAAETAESLGDTAGTAARGAGEILSETADAAEDELD